MRISCAPCAQVLDLAEKYGGHLALSDKKPDKARGPPHKVYYYSTSNLLYSLIHSLFIQTFNCSRQARWSKMRTRQLKEILQDKNLLLDTVN